MKNKIISTIVEVIMIFLLWYVMLPPLNPSAPEFWSFIIFVIFFSVVIYLPATCRDLFKRQRSVKTPRFMVYLLGSIAGFVGIIAIINAINSPLFNSQKYEMRITVDDTREFTEDVAPVDFTKIPLLDKTSSQKLGDRKMGQATEWVSQFYVSDLYTQINYNDKIMRVTPIEYADIIKYFSNKVLKAILPLTRFLEKPIWLNLLKV